LTLLRINLKIDITTKNARFFRKENWFSVLCLPFTENTNEHRFI